MAEQQPVAAAGQVNDQHGRSVERAYTYGKQSRAEFWRSPVASDAIVIAGTLLVAWLLYVLGA